MLIKMFSEFFIIFVLTIKNSLLLDIKKSLQESFLTTVILSRVEFQECGPVIIRPNSQNIPDYLSNILYSVPQLMVVPDVKISLALKANSFRIQFSKACSIVLYYLEFKEENINLLTSFKDDFIRNLPGGIFDSYHIIFSPTKLSQFISKHFAKMEPIPLLMLQMHHVVFVFQKSQTLLELSAPTTSFNASTSLGHFQINNSGSKIISASLFRERWKDFQGRPVKLATTAEITQKQMDEFIRTKKFSTYSIVGTYEIFRYINATPVIHTVKSGIFGQKKPDGTWIGMIGEMLEGRADVITVTQLLPERAEVVEYTKVYHFDSVIFITALPRTAKQSGSIEFLAKPFSALVWWYLLLTFVVIFLAFLIATFLRPSPVGTPTKSLHIELLFILNFMMRPVADQSADTPSIERRLKHGLVRFIFGIWLFGMISLTCAYRSKLISALLKPNIVHPPKTFEELVDSNYGIGSVQFNESFLGQRFRAMNNKIGHEITKRVKTYKVIDPTCFTEILVKDQVCMGIKGYFGFFVDVFLTGENGQSLYQVSKDSLFPIQAAMSVPKRFPHLRNLLNQIIERVESQGLIIDWENRGKRVNIINGRRKAKLVGKSSTQNQESSEDQHVQHFIAILLFGSGISMGTFVLEHVVNCSNLVKRKFFNTYIRVKRYLSK